MPPCAVETNFNGIVHIVAHYHHRDCKIPPASLYCFELRQLKPLEIQTGPGSRLLVKMDGKEQKEKPWPWPVLRERAKTIEKPPHFLFLKTRI